MIKFTKCRAHWNDRRRGWRTTNLVTYSRQNFNGGGQKALAKGTPFYQLARVAGVSGATVSRVANSNAYVSPELRARVLKSAAKLGVDLNRRYRPKVNVIAFLLCNREILHLFHSLVLAGAEAYCASHDYGVLFLSFRYSFDVPWKDLCLPEITTRRDVVRAAIVAGTNSQNLLTLLDHEGMPFVVLGNNMVGEWRSKEHSVVNFDDIEGARELTRYLLSLGHRNIWFVGSSRLRGSRAVTRGTARSWKKPVWILTSVILSRITWRK